MEKQNPLAFGLNGSGAEELKNCFFINSTTWDFNPMDQNDPFESALSSMVSSPVASSGGGGPGGGGGGGDNIMLKELIGRLGSICNSGDISPHSYNNIGGNTSTNTTCYNTPMNSPPKLNLSVMDHKIRGNFPISGSHFSAKPSLIAPFPSDLGFAERVPEFGHRLSPNLGSCKISGASTSNCSKNISRSQINVQENGYASLKLDFPVPDKKITKFSRPSTPDNSGFGDSVEISSLTEQITLGQNTMNRPNESNPRKRKSAPKGKAKEPTSSKEANLQVASESTDIDTKRSKSEEENVVEEKYDTKLKEKSKGTNKKQSKDDDNEPPKDYIHVRARRGQATDAHSLAERVRREKIGERMKMLQNLVPGCNMVTGKAVMLDEIINYVQSLQHQVEFLSMKLATINPRSDLNVESSHMSKDVISLHQGNLQHNLYHQSNASATEFPHTFYSPQGPSMQNAMPNGVDFHYAMNHLNGSSGQNTIIQMPSSDNYGEVPSQVPAFWGNDLHTVVQMGLGQNQTQNLHCAGFMSTDQMKVEQ